MEKYAVMQFRLSDLDESPPLFIEYDGQFMMLMIPTMGQCNKIGTFSLHFHVSCIPIFQAAINVLIF